VAVPPPVVTLTLPPEVNAVVINLTARVLVLLSKVIRETPLIEAAEIPVRLVPIITTLVVSEQVCDEVTEVMVGAGGGVIFKVNVPQVGDGKWSTIKKYVPALVKLYVPDAVVPLPDVALAKQDEPVAQSVLFFRNQPVHVVLPVMAIVYVPVDDIFN